MVPAKIEAHGRKIKYLVVHCTATPQTTTIESIQNHWRKVLGWKSPGYHYIVKPDGTIVNLQPESLASNGVADYNTPSIHISYIGGIDAAGKAIDNRTVAQRNSLAIALYILKQRYPDAVIQGHRDFPKVAKDCPCFHAKLEYASIK